MEQVYPDLWQTKRHSSGILNSYTYLLEHPDGNILFYNTNNEEDLQHIEDLGGIKYQLLTHRDEAGASLNRIRERFGSMLMFSEGEAEAISKYAKADRFFDDGDHKPGDIDVLETPGHTSDCVSFVYKSPHGKTYLFTGDAFFQWNGRWTTLILSKAGGAKPALINSLHKLRVLNAYSGDQVAPEYAHGKSELASMAIRFVVSPSLYRNHRTITRSTSRRELCLVSLVWFSRRERLLYLQDEIASLS